MVGVYFAASIYEGCGHKHHSTDAAAKCLRRVTGPKKGIYQIISTKPFKTRKVL